jgi:hypothetical protein
MSKLSSCPNPLVKRLIPTLGITVVLGLGTAACALPGQLGQADAAAPAPTTTTGANLSQARPTTTTTRPAPTTTAPAPAPKPPAATGRNATLWPFAATSPWNMPIGSGVRLESASDPRTQTVRNFPTDAWLNVDQYSIPVYRATSSDALVTLSDSVHGGSWQVRMPASASAAAGTDANMAVIQPDGRTVDIWQATRTSGTTMSAQSVAFSNITGSGLGPTAGIRASGVSSLGGLIRKWEVDPSDPSYTDGVIRHALAMSVTPDMLQYTGGSAGYDAQGYGTERGYVWPASSQDWGSQYSYKGNLPMGSLLVIPKSVNLNSLGLDAQTMKIAKAMQDYGGYVVDMAGSFNWYAEPTLTGSTFQSSVAGAPNWAAGLRKIRSVLVVVANNGPNSVGGGGTPLTALAPSLG